MKKRLLSILLSVCMVLSLLPGFAQPAVAAPDGSGITGDGTFSNPYIITTADQLAYVAQQVNNNVAGWNTASYKIINNIDLSSYTNWDPIGNSDSAKGWPQFEGTFDGGGYTISNLRQVRDSGPFGLFGSIYSYQTPGVVRNIILTNVVITATNINSNTAIGAIAGYNKGTIENCSVAGTISATSNAGDVWVGGVTGRHWKTVRNCYSTANVSVTGNYGDCGGGIVGQTLTGATTDNCYSTGSVSGSNVQVGAIVGDNYGATASNCYWLSGSASVGIAGGGTATNISSFNNACALNSPVTILGTEYSFLLAALNARVNEVASTDLKTWTTQVVFPVFSVPWAPPTYTATVTVNKNGDAWSGSGKSLALYQSGTKKYDLTLSGSSATASALAGTYDVYIGTTDTDVDISVSSGGGNSATVNYYDVNLTPGTGIAGVTGGGTYLSGETAYVSATLSNGYTWNKWSDNNTTMTSRSITVSAKTDLTASASLTPATAPSLSVIGANLIYGYTSGSVSVTATPTAGHTITGYQWYSNTSNSNTGGTSISGANSASYALATGKAVGTTEYYYCVVTTKRTDNSQTTTATSGVATVTVGKADGVGSVSIAGWPYGETAKTPVPTSTTNGTGSVTYIYEGTGSTSYLASTTAPTNAGTYKVTATFAATASYKQCTATANFTIAPATLNKDLFTFATSSSLAYDGTVKSATVTAKADGTYAAPTGIVTVFYELKTGESTYGARTTTAPVNAGTYRVSIDVTANGNYGTITNFTDSTWTFTIDKATITGCAVSQTGALTYNGSPQTAAVATACTTVADQTATFMYCDTQDGTYSDEIPAHTDAGEYTVYYKVTAPNHNDEFGSFTVTIGSLDLSKLADADITVNPNTVVYTGAAWQPSVTVKSGSSTIPIENYTVSYSNNINTGDVTVTVTAIPTNCTNAKSVTKSITQAELRAELFSFSAGSALIYDGTAKPATVTAKTNGTYAAPTGNIAVYYELKTGDNSYGSRVTTVPINAGTYRVSIDVTASGNYQGITNLTAAGWNFTIAKAPVSFAVSDNTHNYDKAAHSATVTQTASETPSVAGNFTVTYQKDTEPAAENETNVGVYKIIVTLNNDNFKFAEQEDAVRSLTLTDKLTIEAVAYPDADTITLPTAGSLTYGQKLSDSTLTGGDPGCDYAWKTGTTIPTVMNTGYAVVCTPKNANYAPFEKTVFITVAKATPTLTLPTAGAIIYGQKLSDSVLTGGSASATYNGAANTNVLGAYSWSVGTTAPQVSDSNSTQYEVTFTPSDTDNYSTATGKITLIVNRKPVTLTWDYTTPLTYDGTAKTVTATVSNKVDEGGTFNLTFSDNSKTSAGSYTAEVTALGNGNYTLTGAVNASKAWVIDKAPISFNVSNNSYTYDAASHTVTVAQAASGTPVIATGKFAVTYKLPADSSSTADKTDAGVYDVIVTLSDDNFCFAGESDAATRSHKVGTLTIKQKTVTALWKNTTTVYDGSEKSPVLELVGLQTGDTGVTARLTESKTDADTYTVTAELSGANSGNYTLTNPTETFIIQKAPVSFTLTGNSVKKGESVNVIATPSVNGISATLTYWLNGKQVASPTDVGSYDIYATFSDPNYRHAGGTDSTAQKIGVLTIYESSTPATYTVNFDANGGTGDTASMNAVQAGTVRILPESGFTSTGKIFAGWQYNGKSYQPGECFTQPSANVTLKALWNDKAYAIGGTVLEGDPVSNAANVVVTLMLGSRQIGQTVTGADGAFGFANVVPGVYNLVANKDGVTQTVMVTVKDEAVTNQTITMPAGKLNSVVEIKAGSPAIVVGDLEKAFTQQDKTDAASKTVELRLTAGVKAADSANNAQQEIEKKAGSVDLFLEFTLTKTVDGTSSTLNSSPVLLAAVITLPAELQGKDSYTVYRYHGAEVQILTTTANTDGEKIEVGKDKTTITVYTKNFSAYAIQGVTYSGGGGDVITSYTISASAGEGGSISPSGKVSVTGGSKTFIITANEGYDITDIKVDGVSVGAVSSYTFSNVGANHTIEAVFERKENAVLPYYIENGKEIYIGFASDASGTMTYIAPEGATVLFRENPKSFTDIAGHWAKDNIDFVTERELFLGTGGGDFSPQSGMTRAMFATVIGRLYERSYGKILQKDEHAFTDVDYDAYYGAYIDWASENNILTGIGGGLFKPDQEITRQEMAAILYRFAKFLNVSPSESDKTKPNFPDAADIASWAAEAASYCQQTGIITGRSGGYFVPQGTVTRAEVAAILQRFIESSVKQLNDN
jgi:hypothetical protein